MESLRQDIENVLNITAACHGLEFEQAAFLNWRLLLSMRCKNVNLDFDGCKINIDDDISVHLARDVLRAYGKGEECNVPVSESQDLNKGYYRSSVIVKALEIIFQDKNGDIWEDRAELEECVKSVYADVLVPELERLEKASRDKMLEMASSVSNALYATGNSGRIRFWGIARDTVGSMSLFDIDNEGKCNGMACKSPTLCSLSDSVALTLAISFVRHASLEFAREMKCSMHNTELEEFLEFLQGTVQDTILKQVFKECSSGKSKQADTWNPLMREIVNSTVVKGREALRGSLERIWVTCRTFSKPENIKNYGGLATSILVQYSDLMAQLGVLHGDDEDLWDLLMWSLKQNGGVQRKRGVHILEGLVSVMPEDASLGWKYFLQLYHAIDDTSVHLFKASWEVIYRLHPESGDKQILPFRWILFIWELGIMHRQPTCNKTVILSFLTRNWTNEDLRQLTPEFLGNVLLPYLGQGSLAKGTYAPEIQSAIPEFFGKWAKALEQNVDMLLRPIMKYLSGPHSQAHVLLFGARAIEAVINSQSSSSIVAEKCSIEISETLQSNILQAFASQNVIGSNFVGIQVQSALMGVLPLSVAVFTEETLEWVMKCFKAVPKALIQPGGSLHEKAVDSLSKILARISDRPFFNQVMQNKVMEIIESPKLEFKTLPAWSQSFAKVLLVFGEIDPQLMSDILAPLDTRIHSKVENWTFGLIRLLHDLMDTSTSLRDRPACFSNLAEWILVRNMQISKRTMEFFHLLDTLKSIRYENIQSYHQLSAAKQENENLELETRVDADFAENREASAISIQNLGALLEIMKQQQGSTLSGQYSKTEDFVASSMSELIMELSALSGDIDEFRATIHDAPDCTEADANDMRLKRALLDECILILTRLAHASFDCLCHVSLELTRMHEKLAVATSRLLDFTVMMLHNQYTSTMDSSILRSSFKEVSNVKKRSKKTHPLTLEKWRTLLCWRMLDMGFSYANQSQFIDSLKIGTLSSVIAFGMACLTTVTDGNLIILPILHCIAFAMPRMVCEWNRFKEPLLAAFEHVGMQDFSIVNASDAIKAIGRILLSLMMGQTRKKSGIAATILKTCIHPQFFSGELIALPEVLQMHEEGGALQDIVQELVNIGRKYNRLLIFLSLHLSSLLADKPTIGICYRDILVSMCSVGFVDQANTAILKDEVLDPSTANEISEIYNPLDIELFNAYKFSDIAPRIATLCLLHRWAVNSAQGDADYLRGSQSIWKELFKLSQTDPDLVTSQYGYTGTIHRRKLRVWQALAILSPCIEEEEIPSVIAKLLEILDVMNAVSVKQYQENILAYLLKQKPALILEVAIPRILDYSSQRNEALPSLATAVAVALIQLDPKCEAQNDTFGLPIDPMNESEWRSLLLEFTMSLLPWTGSFPHPNRTFSQLVLWRLAELYPFLTSEIKGLQALCGFFAANNDLNRLRKAMGVEAGLEQFSFRTALSPLGVLCQPTCLIGTNGGSEKVLEGAPEPLMDAIHDYLIHQRDDLRKQQGEMMKSIMAKQISTGRVQLEQEKEANATAETTKTTHQDKNFWQKKITPLHHKVTALQTWKEALGIDVLENSTASSSRDQEQTFDIDAAMIESLFATQEDIKRQELIVVASLIDKLPNLAGITRTCEIFRAKKLIVGDLSIKNDPSFSKISVSADQWVDFEQVSTDILKQWLETMAQSGYQLVGLEQTEDSCPLQEFSFAPKTVLVLGAEKQGIPADILQVLHETVEIPQLGIIRSLNVHVSAAITMYEYTRQQQM